MAETWAREEATADKKKCDEAKKSYGQWFGSSWAKKHKSWRSFNELDGVTGCESEMRNSWIIIIIDHYTARFAFEFKLMNRFSLIAQAIEYRFTRFLFAVCDERAVREGANTVVPMFAWYIRVWRMMIQLFYCLWKLRRLKIIDTCGMCDESKQRVKSGCMRQISDFCEPTRPDWIRLMSARCRQYRCTMSKQSRWASEPRSMFIVVINNHPFTWMDQSAALSTAAALLMMHGGDGCFDWWAKCRLVCWVAQFG